MIENNITAFEQRYNKAKIIYIILALLTLCAFLFYALYYQIIYDLSKMLVWLLITMLLTIVLRTARMVIFSRIAYAPIADAYEQGDIQSAYEISNELIKRDTRYSDSFILLNHMTILVNMGRYDELQEFYTAYKDKILKRVSMQLLERELLIFTSHSSEQIIYENYYRRYMKKMKRHQNNKHQRSKILTQQLQHALLHKDDVEIHKLLELFQPSNKHDELYKAYCEARYYLENGRREEAQPFIDVVLSFNDAYASVREIKNCADNGAYEVTHIPSSFIQICIDEAERRHKKKKRIKRIGNIFYVIAIIYLLMISWYLSTYKQPYESMEQAVNEISERRAGDVYMQFDMEDAHIALVQTFGQHEKDENFALALANGTGVYYVTSVIVDHDQIRYLNMSGGTYAYDGFTMASYPIKHTDYTYVMIQGNLGSVTYDGKEIKDIKQADVYGLTKKDIFHMNAFIIKDKNFSSSKLSYQLQEQ